MPRPPHPSPLFTLMRRQIVELLITRGVSVREVAKLLDMTPAHVYNLANEHVRLHPTNAAERRIAALASRFEPELRAAGCGWLFDADMQPLDGWLRVRRPRRKDISPKARLAGPPGEVLEGR